MNHFRGVKSNSGLSSWQRKLDSHAVFHHFVIWKALLLPRGLKGKKKKQATVDNVTEKRSSFFIFQMTGRCSVDQTSFSGSAKLTYRICFLCQSLKFDQT